MYTRRMKPPKCKVCGKEEWRHVCRPDGAALRSASHPVGEPTRRRDLSKKAIEKIAVEVVPMDAAVVRVSRKEYLKLKARDRRQRERKAADKAGITVAEWRSRAKLGKGAGGEL